METKSAGEGKNVSSTFGNRMVDRVRRGVVDAGGSGPVILYTLGLFIKPLKSGIWLGSREHSAGRRRCRNLFPRSPFPSWDY